MQLYLFRMKRATAAAYFLGFLHAKRMNGVAKRRAEGVAPYPHNEGVGADSISALVIRNDDWP